MEVEPSNDVHCVGVEDGMTSESLIENEYFMTSNYDLMVHVN